MSAQLQTTEHLLANRALLNLDRAKLYLATRVRATTPLGAVEFLQMLRTGARDEYDERVSIALDCLDIYRKIFPEEYARSGAPHFSIQREHEFYRLVHTRLFPLFVHEDDVHPGDLLRLLEDEPQLFIPFIPVRGMQRHTWAGGQFNFWQIELCYQIAQVLSWRTGAEGAGWQALSLHYGMVGDVSAPAPPLGAVGWHLFEHSCYVEETPLRFLPAAFYLIGYETGNVWLDLPNHVGYVAHEWSARNVADLLVKRMKADQTNTAMKALDIWLEEAPRRGIARAVEIWNAAARKEEQSFEEFEHVPLGNGLTGLVHRN